MKDLLNRLNSLYEKVKEPKLPFRRFKHKTVLSLIEDLKNNSLFNIESIGTSIEGRPIQSITLGSGNRRILVWTQMHGNEPTATRATFDFLNFCNSEHFEADYSNLLNEVTICLVPVLNPDGLERYQRRNALDIDPNRDAARRATPEMQALFALLENYKPDWCFNMHDQRNLFNVDRTKEPATLSFLSPSTADGKRGQNQSDAMMMIDKINQALQEYIPNKIGRFTHEFYPTASGDNIQSLGYRTILVESGGHIQDVEREVGRKMNFMLLWKAIELVGSGGWSKGTALRYSEIPKNDQKLFDLLIRNVGMVRNDQVVYADLGIDRVEIPATLPEGFVVKSSVREIGDLSYYFGYEEINAEGAILGNDLKLNGLADFSLINNNETSLKVVNGFVVHG